MSENPGVPPSRSSDDQPDPRLHAIFDAVPTAMIMVNRLGKITRINAEAEQLFGYTRDELMHQPIELLIPDRFREMHIQHVQDFFANPQSRKMGIGRELIGLRKDRTVFLAELALGPVEIENEAFVLASIVDITERKRIERDFGIAREIQISLLPNEAPRLKGFDIAGACQPANETGGDFFDYIETRSGKLVIVVGDASGHGFGPALLSATTKCSIRTLLRTQHDLPQVLKVTNELLSEASPSSQFVTVIAVELDHATGSLDYCAAGQDAFILNRSGIVQHQLSSSGTPLGIAEGGKYQLSSGIALGPGEIILIPTDGTYEARSPDGKFFGKKRMFDIVKTHRQSSAQEIIDALRSGIEEFCHVLPRQDDVTIVVIKAR